LPFERFGHAASELEIENQDVGANRTENILHNALVLRVRTVSFKRRPIREPHDHAVSEPFTTLGKVHSRGQFHNARDFAFQPPQFRYRAVNRCLTRFLGPPNQNYMLDQTSSPLTSSTCRD
jgi:hypothetical protein